MKGSRSERIIPSSLETYLSNVTKQKVTIEDEIDDARNLTGRWIIKVWDLPQSIIPEGEILSGAIVWDQPLVHLLMKIEEAIETIRDYIKQDTDELNDDLEA